MHKVEINHAEYMEKVTKMTDDALLYTIADAKGAITANPDGPKSGYYVDEVHYCSMELANRRKQKK